MFSISHSVVFVKKYQLRLRSGNYFFFKKGVDGVLFKLFYNISNVSVFMRYAGYLNNIGAFQAWYVDVSQPWK